MPLHSRLLQKKRPGDQINADDWNALIDMVKRGVFGPGVIEDHLGWHLTGGGPGGGRAKWGRIVDAGPNSEPDFDDGRYWVHPLKRVGSEPLVDAFPTYELVSGTEAIFAAVNVCEIGFGTSGNGWHGILEEPSGLTGNLPDRTVMCRMDGGFWSFDSYPGPIVEEFHARVTDCDTNGCPVVTWDKGIAAPTVDRGSAPTGC